MRFFVGLSLILLHSLANAAVSCLAPNQCEIVIDAGSTGSRAYVYQYQRQKDNSIRKLDLVSKRSKSGGLANTKVSEMAPYLDDLLLPILTDLSSDSPVSVAVYGTAGMRLLSESEQSAIYQALGDYIIQHGFILKDARTISGAEEGLFAWLGVNAKMLIQQNLQEDDLLSIIDIGGASTQIAYIEKTANTQDANTYAINWRGNIYYVHSQSFLGLGLNEARHQFMDDADCFSRGYPMSNGTVGLGNAKLCTSRVFTLIKSIHDVKVHVPETKWAALGALPFLAKSVTPALENHFTLSTLLQKGREDFCETSWYDIKERLPGDVNYTFGYCFQTSYLAALLQDAYGLAADADIYPEGDDVLGWTAGALIYSRTPSSIGAT